LPNFPIDLFKGFFHPLLDLPFFFAQVFELAQVLDPWPFMGGRFQLVLNGLGDELAQRDAPFGRHGLGPAKKEVGDFQSCFHLPILPYLWD
jgi:hypothetical protein